MGGTRAAVVVVGSEILLDGREDTNGPLVEETLRREGIQPDLRIVAGDDPSSLGAALRAAAARADVIVVSGGLGPTFDDVTREAASEALGRPLRRSAELAAGLRERYARRGLAPVDSVLRMADLIEGAEPLRNAVGSAPGQFLAGPPVVALLPGVPAELEPMLREEVVPRLRRLFRLAPPSRAVFKIAGRYESQVEGALAPLMKSWKDVDATILASPGEVMLILRAAARDAPALESAAASVRAALGGDIYAESEVGLETAVGRMLAAARLTLATAESCTGGMLGGMITSVAGSSAYYLGGAVAYAGRIKEGWLGVPAETLARHGEVSPQTALAMARGVRERAGSDLGLAVTGVAGPGGGRAGKPVGFVCLAVAAPWGPGERTFSLPGDRATIRLRSCRLALDLLRRVLLLPRGEG
jgi:nicotinamide-nucleotide amidase